LAALLTTPLDVCKTTLQTRGLSACAEVRACDSALKAARLLYRREGLRAFWRGAKARMLAHMPATAISWSVYEYFKYVLANRGTTSTYASNASNAPSPTAASPSKLTTVTVVAEAHENPSRSDGSQINAQLDRLFSLESDAAQSNDERIAISLGGAER
jgi:hypothetical protein